MTDVLLDALINGLDHFGVQKTHLCILNATGNESSDWDRQSHFASVSVKNTLKSDYNTVLVRATRQTAETLGLVAMAQGLVSAAGSIVIAQENRLGASSLERALRAGFENVISLSKYKCRTLRLQGPKADVLKGWAGQADLQRNPLGFWSMPGLFSWDRGDVGSDLLLRHLPDILTGSGADLGCGYGYLGCHLKTRRGVTHLTAIDLDSRAVECTRRNLAERELSFPFDVLWQDVTTMTGLKNLDWIMMNPPFHTQTEENRQLGQKFCEAALKMLRSGGNLYLVANRHMPYEAVLKNDTKAVHVLADERGFKILHAVAR